MYCVARKKRLRIIRRPKPKQKQKKTKKQKKTMTSCYGEYGVCNIVPKPPRVWSRVQNRCVFDNDNDNNNNANEVMAKYLEKGNILQYKANSSNLTTWQRYSKIAKGEWVNRNITWASQSLTSSNPNTTWLKRSGNVTHLAIDPITGAILGPTNLPLTSTCLTPIDDTYEYLPETVDPTNDPNENTNLPNVVAPSDASNTFPPIEPVVAPVPLVIADGGTLVCSIQENTCTGETTQSLSQILCHPASDSDVPGQSELCWDDGMQTWYPRQRYVMSNSTDKWPYNYKGLASSIRPTAPILQSVVNHLLVVTLTWSQPASCLPIGHYNLYQNGVLIRRIAPPTLQSFSVDVYTCGTYVYSMTSVTNGSQIESDLSNEITLVIASTTDPNVEVLWSVTDLYSPWMYLHVRWSTVDPICANLTLDNTSLFRLTVEDANSNVLYTEDVPYDPTATEYDVYLSNIEVSEHGKVYVEFVSPSFTTLSSKGLGLYRTVSLPLFTFHYMDNNRSELNCRIISVRDLYPAGQLIYGNGNGVEDIHLTNTRFQIEETVSPTYIVERTVLPNLVLEYNIVMSASLLNKSAFPYLFALTVSNTSGIKEQVM